MRWASIIGLRLRSLLQRNSVEYDLDEELQYHLERQIDENVAAGMNRNEARHAALRTISGLTQRKEECRDMRGFNFIDSFTRDFQYAMRQLRKNPGFTATAILVLALGMCASVAIFAFVDAALIKPLPYRDPARLLGVYEESLLMPPLQSLVAGFCRLATAQRRFQLIRYLSGQRLRSEERPMGPQQVRGARVSDELPAHPGRRAEQWAATSQRRDNLPSAPRTAMLSYATWQTRYGGKSDIVGQAITLDSEPVTIIAVLPRDFQFGPVGRPDFWIAYQPTGGCDKRRSCHGLYGVARLKDGVSMQAALANVTAITTQLQKEYPDSNNGQGAAVQPLAEVIVGNVRPILLVLLGGAALLLMIAAVNVAGLQLVRSESRVREIAVRSALGASSARLTGQFLTEAVVLTVAATTAGTGICRRGPSSYSRVSSRRT